MSIEDREIERIDAEIERALATGDIGSLRILGYGEVSCVVAAETGAGRFAVKRLPPFADEGRFERYRTTLGRYVEKLESKGIRVAASTLHAVPKGGGALTAYCAQPMVDAQAIGPKHMASLSESAAKEAFERLVDTMVGAMDPKVGLDGQISNWAWVGGEPLYLDVTTPLLRDAEGREELDVDLFLASLPALLRPLVKRFLLQAILDKYYDGRGVLLDLVGNLIKERLTHLLAPFLEVVNARVDKPITEQEARAYYKDDAGTWALLQRLRAADRFVTKKVLRRPYPFLLPGKIER